MSPASSWRWTAVFSVLLTATTASGCGRPLEGDLPPPKAASPEEMETAVKETTANMPSGGELPPDGVVKRRKSR